MTTDVDFVAHIYHSAKTALVEALKEWDDEYHALDVGIALGMLACEVGWDAGRATMPNETLMEKVKASLRILEDPE